MSERTVVIVTGPPAGGRADADTLSRNARAAFRVGMVVGGRGRVVVALVASVLAVAGGGLAAAFGGGQGQTPVTTTGCVFGASAVGPITIDEQGEVSGDTTPATIGCTGETPGGAGP